MLKKVVARILQLFIVTGLLAVFLSIACWTYPPLAILGLAVGAAAISDVFYVQSVRRVAAHLELGKIRQRISSESRLGRRDGEYEPWRTASTAFWIPKDNWHAMPNIIGQEEMGVYAHAG